MRRACRQQGFVLLAVLLSMALLALLVTRFTASARTETRVVMNLRTNAIAQSAVDGALHEAVLHLLQGIWLPDGHSHVVQVGDTRVDVRAWNLARKINPNTASPPVLAALLTRMGGDPARGAILARAIADWRARDVESEPGNAALVPYIAAGLSYGPSRRPFDSVGEVGLVAGMTPVMLARIRPFLSVYQEGDPLDDTVDPVDAAADDTLTDQETGWVLGGSGRVMVVSIEAAAAEGTFIRRATVRLRAEPSADRALFEILTWESVARE